MLAHVLVNAGITRPMDLKTPQSAASQTWLCDLTVQPPKVLQKYGHQDPLGHGAWTLGRSAAPRKGTTKPRRHTFQEHTSQQPTDGNDPSVHQQMTDFKNVAQVRDVAQWQSACVARVKPSSIPSTTQRKSLGDHFSA